MDEETVTVIGMVVVKVLAGLFVAVWIFEVFAGLFIEVPVGVVVGAVVGTVVGTVVGGTTFPYFQKSLKKPFKYMRIFYYFLLTIVPMSTKDPK